MLSDFFAQHSKVAVAFSGGVDSAYLLYAAKKHGAQVKAYYVKTPFQPQFEYDDAMQLAAQLDVPLQVLTVDILSDKTISQNPQNRCYYCKKQIFTAICQQADRDGFPAVLDGTNASDDSADRPGMQALQELGILSPLRQCGLTKPEIRKRSRQAGLFTHDKPAYACLATRFPAGMVITAPKLAAVERSETFLKELGFSDFRVRFLEDCARIQIPESQFPLLLQHRQTILTHLKQDYNAVLLDLEVRE